MANYVLTLALKTELWHEHILEKRLNIARMIYNSCLSEILKRHRKMINSSEYKEITNLDKKEQSKRYKVKTGFEPSQQDVNILNGELVH